MAFCAIRVKQLRLCLSRRVQDPGNNPVDSLSVWFCCLQDPNIAIVQHPEHKDLYAADPYSRGFDEEVLIVMLDVVKENVASDGFRCAEIGAGTGGFTRQASVSLLDTSR